MLEESSFEEMVAELIRDDPELMKILREKVKVAIEAVDITEAIKDNVTSFECAFEDLDLKDGAEDTLAKTILKKALEFK